MKAYFWILNLFPQICRGYLLKLFPDFFHDSERIVRFVFDPSLYNSTKGSFKASFFHFKPNPESNKNEMSCNRLEVCKISKLRKIGEFQASKQHNTKYYGVACADVSSIRKFEAFILKFTPDFKRKNYSHLDIYSPYTFKNNEARPAQFNYLLDEFKDIWKVYPDEKKQLKSKEIFSL